MKAKRKSTIDPGPGTGPGENQMSSGNSEPGLLELIPGNTPGEPGKSESTPGPEPVKRGRKKKEVVQEDIFDRNLTKIFAGLVPFELLCILLKTERYRATDSEKEFLAEYWQKVFNKYLPEFLASYKEEYALLGAIGLVLIAKVDISSYFPLEAAGVKKEENE